MANKFKFEKNIDLKNLNTEKKAARDRFSKEIESRETVETNYHDIFDKIEFMEVGQELQSDQWLIVCVPNGWMVWRINIGSIFIPRTI